MTEKHGRPPSAVLVERNGKFFFYDPDVGVIASGGTVESAFAQFTRARSEHLEQVEQAGIPVVTAPSEAAEANLSLRHDMWGELKIFLAKAAIVLVVLVVAGLVAAQAVGGAADKLAGALAPLGSISMVDIANKAEMIVKDVQAMPAERKEALRRSLAILSREADPIAEAWRNPASVEPSAGQPTQAKP
jgi:hypothetical protein